MHWHWHCIEFCIVIVLAFLSGEVHTVGHASPPLDAASWRRSSAFSSARRLSSAVGSSAPSGSGSSSEERGAGAGGRGDPRADFEPAILPFQGMRRHAVAADHFHALPGVSVFTLRAAAVEQAPGVSVFQTYACLAPDQAPRQWWQ